MLNFPVSKLNSAIADFQLDSSDFNPQDDKRQVIEDTKEDARKILIQVMKDYSSRIKTKEDVSVLLREQSAALQKRDELKKVLEQHMKSKRKLEDKKALHGKIINLYRKYLGFQMERVQSATEEISESYSISFQFHNIHKSKPQESAVLILTTDGANYKVTKCLPPIDTLDELVSELCKDNNLEKFILQVRRKFCAIAANINTK